MKENEKKKKSGDFRVTHQAAANRWSLVSHMVSFVALILFPTSVL